MLLYIAPPFAFGWFGAGVAAPVIWWAVLAFVSLAVEYRPSPGYNEFRSKSIALAIALVAFVSIYYVARWLAAG